MTPRDSAGLTLIELMLSLAILVVLAGIVYAATGSARERARQAHCVSNLHQLGVAFLMYRQDYGGTDRPGWPDQMGFPPSPAALYLGDRPGGGAYMDAGATVCRCPNAPPPPAGVGVSCDYLMGWWGWGMRENPRYVRGPTFPNAIRERGDEMPILIDRYHARPSPYEHAPHTFIVLRLNGRVSVYRGPMTSGWKM